MKTKEELTAIKEEVAELAKKLAELSDDELKQVSGGLTSNVEPKDRDVVMGSYAYA